MPMFINSTQGAEKESDGGSQQDRLFQQTYGELRRIAAKLMGPDSRVRTISATTLVHEAYLRLRQASRLDNTQTGEFLAIAAGAMRQVLVDKVRRKPVPEPEAGEVRVAFEEEGGREGRSSRSFDVLRLDAALRKMSELDVRMAQVVEMRIFAGLEMDLIASLLGVPRRTIYVDWAVARRWLAQEMAEA